MTNQPFNHPMAPATPRADNDESHLRILSILYYVLGGIMIVSALSIAGLYVAILFGITASTDAQVAGNAAAPMAAGLVLVLAALLVLALGVLLLFAGNSVAKRRRWALCLVMGCLNLGSFPLGTALGVFAIMVLTRPTVKALFNASSRV